MDQIVNNILLAWKLACMLIKTYTTCKLIVRFSKYVFNNKLLGGVVLYKRWVYRLNCN